jgi:hypothetical protein
VLKTAGVLWSCAKSLVNASCAQLNSKVVTSFPLLNGQSVFRSWLRMELLSLRRRPRMKICRFGLVTSGLICLAVSVQAAHRQGPPANALGSPVRDAEGHGINYSRQQLSRTGISAPQAVNEHADGPSVAPRGFVPAGGTAPPFWQYAIFGSAIGLSNIIIDQAPAGGGAREIIIGGNSGSDFGADDFWQVLRHNATTGSYDAVFVSPLYTARIKRIVVGNVVGDAQQEIAVALQDGRIYLYDLATKAERGLINTGINGLEAFCLADLDGDGYAELIVVTNNSTIPNGLFVFDRDGNLLWQVAGAWGSDVVCGQMDNDPALEIAISKGYVVDTATHAVQWAHTADGDGFGYYLKLAPLPGANYQQLIGANMWNHVDAYDVATQSVRWTINTPQDIGAIEIADVDNDGTPEVIIGDGQFGTVHVHDLITQAQKWAVTNPAHGVTNIAVADVDNDGVLDLIWGAGYSSTDSDFLYVANTTGSHAIKWHNVDLVGPFLGPVIGDLDGDGQPELVVCSFESESSYESGRILVFDAATLDFRGISPGVVGNFSWTGVQDLKLRDVDGDGRMEIVVAADRLYDGVIEIYGFNSSNTFTLKWTNATRPPARMFTKVDVADLDGNGTSEIIGGTEVNSVTPLYIFDYPSTTNPWLSPSLTGTVTGLVVEDLDGHGGKEFAVLVSNGDLYTFDGPTRQLESVLPQTGGKLISRRSPSGLIKGDAAGVGHFLQYSNNSYTESFSRQLASATPDGINVLPDGGLWTGTGGALNLRVPPSYDSVEWQSPFFGVGFGRFVATDFRNGQARVFSSARHAVAGFVYESSLPTPTPTPTPGSLGNISTRLSVETGDNVLIGGFIVTGTQPKKVILRAIGPSLPVTGALSDPILELRDSSGALIQANDNWRSEHEAEIIATTVPPSNDLESAIVATLPAYGAAYTAIVRGVNNGTGVGLIEAYDLDRTANSKLANISTRGLVQTGENVLIAGTIVLGETSKRVLVRAIGPSLAIPGKLEDPTLELRD